MNHRLPGGDVPGEVEAIHCLRRLPGHPVHRRAVPDQLVQHAQLSRRGMFLEQVQPAALPRHPGGQRLSAPVRDPGDHQVIAPHATGHPSRLLARQAGREFLPRDPPHPQFVAAIPHSHRGEASVGDRLFKQPVQVARMAVQGHTPHVVADPLVGRANPPTKFLKGNRPGPRLAGQRLLIVCGPHPLDRHTVRNPLRPGPLPELTPPLVPGRRRTWVKLPLGGARGPGVLADAARIPARGPRCRPYRRGTQGVGHHPRGHIQAGQHFGQQHGAGGTIGLGGWGGPMRDEEPREQHHTGGPSGEVGDGGAKFARRKGPPLGLSRSQPPASRILPDDSLQFPQHPPHLRSSHPEASHPAEQPPPAGRTPTRPTAVGPAVRPA